MPENRERPAPPKTAEPSPTLVAALRNVLHSEVAGTGLTTTSAGEWAALIRVRPGVEVPLHDVAKRLHGFKVFYETEPSQPSVARPAYPEKGE